MTTGHVFASSFAVGLSGAMSPGPLLVVVIAETVKSGMAAPLLMMAGHAVLELGMTAGLFFGLQRLSDLPWFEPGLSCAGGVVMLLLAAGMLRALPNVSLDFPDAGKRTSGVGALGALRLAGLGAGVSVLNPYWTVWWLTIGAGFMATAGVASASRAAAFYTGHILSDVAWYVFVGILVIRARRFLTVRVYRGVLGLSAVILACFGAAFLYHGVGGIL
ncbi:MAG: LysE family transporter [Candidatus Coatesbacteria bacterium]